MVNMVNGENCSLDDVMQQQNDYLPNQKKHPINQKFFLVSQKVNYRLQESISNDGWRTA